jgi:hypothetical protein
MQQEGPQASAGRASHRSFVCVRKEFALKAFHNDPEIKAKYVARIQAHRAAEHLVQAYGYWLQGRGCAVGCTLETDKHPHGAYETELGIPRVIAYLEDRFFEGMPEEAAMAWPERFLSAIPVGADLSHVIDHFMIWMLVDEEAGVIRFAREDGKQAIVLVAALYQRKLTASPASDHEWYRARVAAYAAARTAADAADAAAYAAARTAADAADAAADAAARTADAFASDARTAARTAYAFAAAAHFERMAEKLLELLAAAPVPVEAA